MTNGTVMGPAGRQFFACKKGTGAPVLLIHGAGSSHKAWEQVQDLLPDNTTLAVDLPGHGASPRWAGSVNYDAIAESLLTLTDHMGWAGFDVVGHSAGAAVALEMARNSPQMRVLCVNPALDSFTGPAKFAFPAAARMLDAFAPARGLVQSWLARPSALDRLLGETGSQRTPTIDAHYSKLAAQDSHVAGTIRLMAHWDLSDLQSALPQITAPVTMLVGANDRVVPPAVGHKAAARLPNATLEVLPGMGHLLHEEDPNGFAARLRATF